LQRPQLTNAAAIFEEYGHDPAVTKYLIWRPHKDIHETIDFLTGALARWESGEELTWGITLKSNDRVIGMVAWRGVCGVMPQISSMWSPARTGTKDTSQKP
jgi:ribosomal-protein-alanine N-acetyltransferase